MSLTEAASAFVRLARDRTDTRAGADLLASLSGDSLARLFARFQADPEGRRILAERESLPKALRAHGWLETLPAGSLGRAYLNWIHRHGLTAEYLTRETEGAFKMPPNPSDELRWFFEREQAAHDLWHVITYNGPDFTGEARIVWMMWPQHENTGVFLPMLLSGMFQIRDLPSLIHSNHMARHATWWPALDWCALLPKPLSYVRMLAGIE